MNWEFSYAKTLSVFHEYHYSIIYKINLVVMKNIVDIIHVLCFVVNLNQDNNKKKYKRKRKLLQLYLYVYKVRNILPYVHSNFIS